MLNKWLRRISQGIARIAAVDMKPRPSGRLWDQKAGFFRPQLEILEDRTLLSPAVGFWESSSQYVNGVLYFTANDWSHGQELWKSDGTGNGTLMVADINPGMAGSWPQNLMDVNGTLFFTAEDGVHGRQLWKTDGTQAGTVMLTNFNPSSSVDSSTEFANVNSVLYFSTFNFVGSSGFGQQLYNYELWKSDGTPSGTQMVAEIPESRVYLGLCNVWTPYSQQNLMTTVNGTLYFFVPGDSSTLWKSDGTTGGTTIVARIPVDWYFTSVVTGDLVNVDGTLYFAHAGAGGGELWKSDGTPAGTVMVENFPSYEFVDNLLDANGTLIFSVGSQLWRSDGTATGTVLLADTNPGLSLAGIMDFTLLDGSLYFLTDAEGAAPQLWKSDGTPEGTSVLATIGPISPQDITGYYQSLPGNLTNVNGTLFLTGPDATSGENLWKSDGTSAGTILVQDVDTRLGSPWDGSWNQLNMGLSQFVDGGGILFFQAPDNFLNTQAWSRGTELWKSDGTAAGTVPIADVNPVNGKIIFQNAPPTNHTVVGVTSGNSTTVYSVNANHQLLHHDNVNGWILLRDGIQSVSVVIDSGGHHVVFALTIDQALIRYDTVNGWQNLADPGAIRMMSAGTDASGLAYVFVVLTDGSLTEWQQLARQTQDGGPRPGFSRRDPTWPPRSGESLMQSVAKWVRLRLW
jgi:ELWxxDGT repeat protein